MRTIDETVNDLRSISGEFPIVEIFKKVCAILRSGPKNTMLFCNDKDRPSLYESTNSLLAPIAEQHLYAKKLFEFICDFAPLRNGFIENSKMTLLENFYAYMDNITAAEKEKTSLKHYLDKIAIQYGIEMQDTIQKLIKTLSDISKVQFNKTQTLSEQTFFGITSLNSISVLPTITKLMP